jgi:hypothetical protein
MRSCNRPDLMEYSLGASGLLEFFPGAPFVSGAGFLVSEPSRLADWISYERF